MSKKDNTASEKLQKVVASTGMASRRETERWIAQGRIRVNGKLATLGDRVTDDDNIEIDGKKLHRKAPEKFVRRVIAYHKREGEICTRRDPEGRPTVFQRLPKLKGERWIAVGRLDFNTTGLMLFTNDGELANRLMHPSAGIDREYLVRVMGAENEIDEAMLQRLRDGVMLEDGMARFTDIVEDERVDEDSVNKWFCVCLMEGRNREVRRLWESQGVMVSRLKRVRFGPVFLPARLRQGQTEELTEKDIQTLLEAIEPKDKQ